MRKSFILVGMLMCWNLFAEAHLCSEYEEVFDNPSSTVQFIPGWFEHLEFADNGDNSDYSKEFLQEHGGRTGTLVYKYKKVSDVDYDENDDDYEDNDDDTWKYEVGCSGTLIGKDYFLTAGHCADLDNTGAAFVGTREGSSTVYTAGTMCHRQIMGTQGLCWWLSG